MSNVKKTYLSNFVYILQQIFYNQSTGVKQLCSKLSHVPNQLIAYC